MRLQGRKSSSRELQLKYSCPLGAGRPSLGLQGGAALKKEVDVGAFWVSKWCKAEAMRVDETIKI